MVNVSYLANVMTLKFWRWRGLAEILWAGPTCHHRCPYEREMRETHGGESQGKTEVEVGVMWPQVKKCWQAPEAGRCQSGSCPSASAGSMALLTP